MTEGPYKLPEGWRWVRLSEVAWRDSVTLQPSNQPDTVFHYLGMEHVAPGQWEEPTPIQILGAEIKSQVIVYRPGLVLYGKLRPYLNKVVVPSTEGVASTEFVPIAVNENILEPHYLGAYLRSPSFVAYATRNTTGSRQPRVRLEALWDALIPLPPLEEQRRIVAKVEELMSRIREAKRLRQEAKEEADRLWQAVLAQTFPRPGQDLPEGWRWVRLGEVCKTKMGATPSTKVPNYWDPPEIVWVTPEDMEKGELNFVASSRRLISSKGLKKIGARLFPKGTVLLSTTATIGKVGVALKPLSANQQISALTCIANDDPLFVAYYLLSLGERGLRRLGGTATATHINQTNLRLLPIPLPPLEEQRRIVAHLQAVQEKIKALKEAQTQTDAELKRLEQAILDKAFRGEL